MSATWEYTVTGTPGGAMVHQNWLNRLGQDGWELVAVDGGIAYLKREKKEEQNQ